MSSIRRELIARQGFYTTITGTCSQISDPTPSVPVPITTINGDLIVDNNNVVISDSQLYLKDGANKVQNLPLLLEGDELEVNFRTMKAKITHKFKAIRLLTATGASTSYYGSFYVGASSSVIPNRKKGGRVYCSHCVQNPNSSTVGYAYGQTFISLENGSFNFWVRTSRFNNATDVNSWLSNRTFIVVYELNDPEVEYITLDEKLRSYPLTMHKET